MKKLLGGLLLISLIGRSTILRIDYIAYEVYKSSATIINYLKKEETFEEEISADDIDTVMEEIDTNKRYIKKLLKEKNELVEELQCLMTNKAKTRIAFSETQVMEFQNFNQMYSEERSCLEESIENVNLKSIQQQMLHSDTNYSDIYEQLDGITKSQNKVIAFLEKFVMSGRQTLAVCC